MIERTGGRRRNLDDYVNLSGWATPRQADGEKNVRTVKGALNEASRKGAQNDLGTRNLTEIEAMAKLTAARRKSLPKASFGLPGKRAYPMPDKSHAANAKARASQAVNAGRMSKSTESRIDAQANRVLGKGKSKGR